MLGKGVADVGTWLGRAIRTIFLDRTAFREVVEDPFSTGPALLIGVLSQLLASFLRAGHVDLLNMAATVGIWLVVALVVWLAGKALGGKGSFTATLRGYGFAHSAYALLLLGIVPSLRPLASFLAIVLSLVGVWLGAAEAHRTRGWRTLVFPIVVIAVTIFWLGAAPTACRGRSTDNRDPRPKLRPVAPVGFSCLRRRSASLCSD